MECLNKVQLRGRVGNSVCKSYGADGNKYNRFSVCTERCYNDREGNQVIECTWHNCMVFGKPELPDVETITKGSVVELTGRIRNNKYTDAGGVDHTVIEIIVQDFKVLASDGQ